MYAHIALIHGAETKKCQTSWGLLGTQHVSKQKEFTICIQQGKVWQIDWIGLITWILHLFFCFGCFRCRIFRRDSFCCSWWFVKLLGEDKSSSQRTSFSVGFDYWIHETTASESNFRRYTLKLMQFFLAASLLRMYINVTSCSIASMKSWNP
jgi:hypothetical protein